MRESSARSREAERSRSNVVSRLIDFGSISVTTSRSSRPCAAACMNAPCARPKCSTSHAGSAAARSAIVTTPSASSFALDLGPMPLILRAGSGQMRRSMSPSRMSVSPSGLSSSEAIFARSLFGAMPIEQESPVAARTASLIERATACARSQRSPAGSLATDAGRVGVHVGQIDVDLVDAVVLDPRRDRAHRVLEETRVLPVGVEIDRQQHGVGRELRGFHEPHGRVEAERARRVGRGRGHAPSRIVAQRRELADRLARDRVRHPLRLVSSAASDHDRKAGELRVAQELHRRVERIHVEMRDHSGGRARHGGGRAAI